MLGCRMFGKVGLECGVSRMTCYHRCRIHSRLFRMELLMLFAIGTNTMTIWVSCFFLDEVRELFVLVRVSFNCV